MRLKAILILVALSAALWAATPAKKGKSSSDAKKTATKTQAAKASKSKSKTKKTAGKKSTATKTTAARYRRSTQKEPDPDRYKEIQQSLADKGYFKGPVNGAWGADSVDALKRFQRDQNIGDDGKIGSLSLIALGLGPKRGPSAAAIGEKPENPGPP